MERIITNKEGFFPFRYTDCWAVLLKFNTCLIQIQPELTFFSLPRSIHLKTNHVGRTWQGMTRNYLHISQKFFQICSGSFFGSKLTIDHILRYIWWHKKKQLSPFKQIWTWLTLNKTTPVALSWENCWLDCLFYLLSFMW